MSGKIHSTDDNVPQESIFLETFGIGRNGQDRIIVSFPRCLRKMSPQNQIHWASYLIEDSLNCETLQNYLDNAAASLPHLFSPNAKSKRM